MAIDKRDLTKGSIKNHFIALGFPMFIGLTASMSYALADSFWIGRIQGIAGDMQQAALSNMYILDILLVKLALGLGMGIIAIISPLIGAKNMEAAKKMTSAALLLALVSGSVLCILGFSQWQRLLIFLELDLALYSYAKGYLWFWLPSIILILSSLLLSSAMRAAGNAKIPGMIMLMGSLLNIVFDPLLIFGIGFFPRLEIMGAALVSTSTRLLSFILLTYAAHMMGLVALPLRQLIKLIQKWLEFLQVSIPIIITQILMPLAMFVFMKLINHYGAMAAAGYGPAVRVEAFALIPVMVIGAMVGPIVGQNVGAHDILRIKQTMIIAIRWICIWSFTMAIIFLIFNGQLANMFNEDAAAINAFSWYLVVAAVSMIFVGMNGALTQFLNVTARQKQATVITFIYLFMLAIPLGFTLKAMGVSLKYVYWAMAVANITGFLLLAVASYHRFCQLKNTR